MAKHLKALWFMLLMLGISISATATTVEEFFSASPGVNIQVTNDANYPWDINDSGELVSTMKVHSKSSVITFANQSTYLLVVSFEWKVSSEASYDKLGWSTDGTTFSEISGTTSYAQVSAVLAVGESLSFRYKKDSGGSSGSDCGFIRNLSFSAPYVDADGAEWNYHINQETSSATILGLSGDVTDATIPSSIEDCPVQAIAANAFLNNTTIAAITIPACVTEIGSNAFCDCI